MSDGRCFGARYLHDEGFAWFEVRAHTIQVARTGIVERASGKILAEAHSVVYHGGQQPVLKKPLPQS